MGGDRPPKAMKMWRTHFPLTTGWPLSSKPLILNWLVALETSRQGSAAALACRVETHLDARPRASTRVSTRHAGVRAPQRRHDFRECPRGRSTRADDRK